MTRQECINKISELKSTDDLVLFWSRVKERDTSEWQSGKALEYLIIRAFELNGADVSYPYDIYKNGKPFEQIDGFVYVNNLSCLIECKDYDSEMADFTPLAKIRSQLLRRPSQTIASIFCITGFTEPAKILATYAAPQTILLWEGTEIAHVLDSNCICSSLIKKYKIFTERCIPDYNTLTNSL